MIVECYSADVYCDCDDHLPCDLGAYCCAGPAVFTGPNKRSTDNQRRRHGWKKIKGKDVCPVCAKRRAELKGQP